MRLMLSMIILLFAVPACADSDRMERIDTRPGVTVSFYYMKREGAKASVVLLSGGDGRIGVKNGVPRSKNFLVRSRDLFAENGFNVAIIDKEGSSSRISPEHVEDVRRVVAYVKKDSHAPVWVIGTSMGTISATAVAIAASSEELGGIVLTSSITDQKKLGAVPFQKLDAIRVPVLVVHHEFDACSHCVPGDVPQILRGLKNAPIKKEVFVRGGANPKGDPCGPLYWHGYIGMEKEVVDLISAWIKNPAS